MLHHFLMQLYPGHFIYISESTIVCKHVNLFNPILLMSPIMTVSSSATLISWIQSNTVTQFPNRRSWYRFQSSEEGWTNQNIPLQLCFPMQTDLRISIHHTRMRERWLESNAWWINFSSDSQINASWQWSSWLHSPRIYHQHNSQVECIYLC